MMSNVIAFPEPKARMASDDTIASGAKTLFLHIKRATLIVHYSGRAEMDIAQGDRVGKQP